MWFVRKTMGWKPQKLLTEFLQDTDKPVYS